MDTQAITTAILFAGKLNFSTVVDSFQVKKTPLNWKKIEQLAQAAKYAGIHFTIKEFTDSYWIQPEKNTMETMYLNYSLEVVE
jgi:hypothetical protein